MTIPNVPDQPRPPGEPGAISEQQPGAAPGTPGTSGAAPRTGTVADTGPGPTGPDPTEHSRWRPLRVLLNAMDGDIARLYQERGLAGIPPRFTILLIRLDRRGGMTIRQLADSLGVTHSAMSQTIGALRREGLVDSSPGADARTREVTLTERGRTLVPFLEAEWRATERAVAELEAEVPYALSQVVRDLEAALARRSFHDRILDHLDRPGSETPGAGP